ncbi:MAG: restriction endonuclease subunit S [Psychrobacter sp.]|nr:restriction endonuclease subunit S [Psychrobacter sp.]
MSTKNKVVKLKDICTISAGRSLRGHVPEVKGTGIALVQMKDMNDDGIKWDKCMSIELGGKAPARYIVEDDILLQTKGTVNEVVLVDKTIHDTDNKLVTAPYVFIIKADNEKVLPAYLAWWLRQNPVRSYFSKNASGEKSVSIPRALIENTDIVLPSFDQQKKVIKANEQMLMTKEKLQKLILEQEALNLEMALDIQNNKA